MPKKDAITFIHPIQATGNVSNQMIPEPGIAPEKLMLSQSHLFWIHIFEMHLYKAKKRAIFSEDSDCIENAKKRIVPGKL